MIISSSDIKEYNSRYRATLINSLAGFKQVALIGTQSENGQTNLAIFSSLIHIGANPPLWGLIFRPNTVQRDTLSNILATQYYTINYVSSSFFKQAHQTSAKYPSTVSEFESVGLKPEYIQGFEAPFVEEGIVKIAMKLEQTIPIPLNETILLIGSLQFIEINENMVKIDGFVDLSQEETLLSSGLDAYYSSKKLGRLKYAKVDELPGFLDL